MSEQQENVPDPEPTPPDPPDPAALTDEEIIAALISSESRGAHPRDDD